MKWNETIASKCRYGEIAEKIWGDWDILWEDSEEDYQGHASILAKKGHQYSWYEWWYGSCSGCDTWESAELSDEDIEKEMRDTAVWFNGKMELKKWMKMLDAPPPVNKNYHDMAPFNFMAGIDRLCGGMLDRVNAIRKELGMPPYEGKKE